METTLAKGSTEGVDGCLMNEPLKVLIIEDSEYDVQILVRELRRGGCELLYEQVGTARDMSAALDRQKWDLVISDYVRPSFSGLDALTLVKDRGLDLPFIILSGNIGDDLAVESMKAGAHDYILKNNLSRLVPAIRRELREAAVRRERRQAEKAVQRERDFSKAVLDTAGVLVAVFDLDGRIISFNRACEAVSGYTFQEVQGKVIWDLLIIPEEKELILKVFQDIISGRPNDGESFWITKQGDLCPISWKNTVLLNDRNAVEYVIATGLDITGHRQTESALLLAKKIFENTLSGIVVTDCDGIIQRANPAFTEITGYSEEEVIGKNIGVLECDPEYHHKVVRALSESISYRCEAWNRRRDGTLYLAGFVINAIKNDEGQNIQYVKSFRDITKDEEIRRERQHLQEQSARMQRLSSLSALSAGIVHEIAQPLNSIKLFADGMLYLYEKGLFNLDDFGDNLKDISAQVEQITALINQIRSFANVGRETEVVPCGLNRAVKRIMSFLGRQLSAHGITVKTGLNEKLPRVLGTQSGYEEVVLNLLTNAMHALDAIDNREKEITIRTFRTGGKVVLEVSDNATGIRDEIKEEIFEPLFSTKKPGEGMGLGLSIVQSLVERFNGRIEAQNKIQGGATFRVELPVAL